MAKKNKNTKYILNYSINDLSKEWAKNMHNIIIDLSIFFTNLKEHNIKTSIINLKKNKSFIDFNNSDKWWNSIKSILYQFTNILIVKKRPFYIGITIIIVSLILFFFDSF